MDDRRGNWQRLMSGRICDQRYKSARRSAELIQCLAGSLNGLLGTEPSFANPRCKKSISPLQLIALLHKPYHNTRRSGEQPSQVILLYCSIVLCIAIYGFLSHLCTK